MQKVRLLIWGSTRADLQGAERAARAAMLGAGREVVDVVPAVGDSCPIPRRDPAALDGGRTHGQAWAAYPAGMDLERVHRDLAAALELLGVEVDREVLNIWRDRQHAGADPLPESGLRMLGDLVLELLADKSSHAG